MIGPLFVLALAALAQAQSSSSSSSSAASVTTTTSISLFPVGFQTASLSGSIIGTDAAGTTYELEGVFQGATFTETLYEGSSTISETAAIPTLSLTIDAQCSLGNGQASCVDVVQGATATTTLTQTGPFSPTAIPIRTVRAASSSSRSSSSSSSSSTRRSAGIKGTGEPKEAIVGVVAAVAIGLVAALAL